MLYQEILVYNTKSTEMKTNKQTWFQIRINKISFNDCQPKTIGFCVSTSNLGHNAYANAYASKC